MSDSSANRDAVEQLAEEFVERWRRGEEPSVNEYADAHPIHAERIRRLFPAILLAENMGVPASTGARPTQAAMPNTLGEYRLIREIGRGGMGVVYEAVQEPLGRQVALKVLATMGLADPRFQERFQREARAAARLHHTNIVPVFGVGEHNGIHYYAMQFIAGQGMDQVLRDVVQARGRAYTRPGIEQTSVAPNGPAAAQNASARTANSQHATTTSSSMSSCSHAEYYRGVARVGLQVATALSYAHDQGVLHRDIKPSNLLMDPSGTVWVTDFGLAKTDDDAGLTHTGDFVGTMRYMAPERFRGDSGPSCDVYSLGVTLYEMLTFRPAFDDTDRAKLLDQVLRHEPIAPRNIDKRLPRDLETIVLKAMAKEVPERYASAQAMADDLHQFLADRPIAARRAQWPERTWRWCRRNPLLAGLTCAVAVLLLVILIGSPIMSLRLWEQRQDALDKLWLANVAQAKSQRLTQEAGRRSTAIESLDSARRLLPLLRADANRRLELRNEFFACLALPDLIPAATWNGSPAGTAAVTFDATFEHYARGDEQGGISIRRVVGDVELNKLPDQGIPAQALKFSPDGRFLAVGYHHKHQTNSERFRVWQCDTGRAVLAIDSETGCGEADFSPDSRFVAFGRDGNLLAIHDLQAESTTATTYKVAVLPTAIAFHPGGTKLAVAARKIVEVRELATGKVLSSRNIERDVWALAWHPDGTTLATASISNILLWADENPQPMATLRGHEQVIYALAFHPSGDLLASKAHDGSIRLWDVATRQQLIRTSSVHMGCVPIQFSTDGQRLACASDGSRIWTFDVSRGHECRQLVVPRASMNLPALSADFHPANNALVVAYGDCIRVWDADKGRVGSKSPDRGVRHIRMATNGESAFTGNQANLERWSLTTPSCSFPVNADHKPEITSSGGPVVNIVVGHDRNTLVVRHRDQPPRVIKLDRPGDVVTLGDHPRTRYVALSPHCRHVATGSEFGSDVRIWDAATGKLLHELPINSGASVEYSPDGRWLVVGTETKYAFYDASNWKPCHETAKQPETTPGGMSFSQDASILVVRHSPNQLRLLNPADGSELATLGTTGHQIMSWHRISPDGRYLAAAGAGNLVHLWNLNAIRQQLGARQLDW